MARAGGIEHNAFVVTQKIPPLDVLTGNELFQIKDKDFDAIDIVFPDLNDAQFAQLSKVYGDWSATKTSVLPPSKQKEKTTYRLIDFLPPLIQSLESRAFLVEEKFDSNPFPSLRLFNNCWTTAYSVLKQAQVTSRSFDVFFSSSLPNQLFSNDKFSTKISFAFANNSTVEQFNQAINETLQPGDIILIGSRNPKEKSEIELYLHLALFIDKNLVFEKPGPENRFFSRLNTISNLLETYEGNLFVARRLNGEALPEVATFLNRTPTVEPTFASAVYEYEINKETGRAFLPDSAFEVKFPAK